MSVLSVSDADLDDLRARLRATRWARQWPTEGWAAGFEGAELRRLVEYWASAYDWRKHETAINALPHQFAEVDGLRVHYLRFDAEREGALPLLVANGWPSSFLELIGLAERLSAPSRFGGDPADAFTVIVPSLPGFGVAPQRPAHDGPQTHDLWHRLMREVLSFEQYGVHGSDIGAGDVIRLAQAYPDALTGMHVLDIADPAGWDEASLTDEERAYLDRKRQWLSAEGGYSHEQATRPLTLAQGLTDSPSGLLAWIGEKYRAWSDDPATFGDDFLLTQASLYWFTGAISTSFRPYYERRHELVPPIERVEVPTALALFPADIPGGQPRSWAERTYNIARYTPMPRGGHFAAYEEPELLAEDITVFFRTLR
ncbi:hydrolase [Paractinoplanes abujensis]|uniref:Pimeloyl-ACP methyl ester carboxylesterase n=1 Tax=Paractinoplanes abujensis TaxID=882441 RepID=A0A7W7G0X5_9ACTN|nr:epoxide hydrolase family protein [Actinoplanes abujensis]MBB4692092.1 pimeloyl-ACP methyl ester carboxylesterase [Actinoplanes abujensis]GID16493.1 hydrolase [Actinoplanes abujensis]